MQPDGYPAVGWAHGTTGFNECAPSHYKTLGYEFAAPYELVLLAYVVVAPDYAGLGVYEDTPRKPMIPQYGVSLAQVNSVFYTIQAARSAFKELSKQFVVIGHSQGGSVAWAAAERQAVEPVDGYLGAIAASPATHLLDPAAPVAFHRHWSDRSCFAELPASFHNLKRVTFLLLWGPSALL